MTEREKELLSFLIAFKQTNQYSPSVREIADGLNTKSIPHIHEMLNDLKDKGYIDFKKNQSRTIVIKRFN